MKVTVSLPISSSSIDSVMEKIDTEVKPSRFLFEEDFVVIENINLKIKCLIAFQMKFHLTQR